MTRRDDERRWRIRTKGVHRSIGQELVRIRQDAGLPQAHVARAAGVSPAHLCGIERGTSTASTAVLVAIADVLGADLSVRLYPNTGPRIHDRIQALIVEAMLRIVRPRWRPFVEVPVLRPSRGYIDLVLRDSERPLFVAGEVQSELRRLEQMLRWAQDKSASLPSADLWRDAPPDAAVSRLLILRSTYLTRDVARRFSDTLSTAYPARTRAVHDALTGGAAWPGPGILWARVEGDDVTILPDPPRGVPIGR